MDITRNPSLFNFLRDRDLSWMMRGCFLILAILLCLDTTRLYADEEPKGLSEARDILEQASQAAAEIKNAFFRAKVFHGIAAAQVKAGNLERALAVAERQDNVSKDQTLELISWTQLESGQITNALETAARIKDGYFKASMLIRIGETLAKKAQHKDALTILTQALTASSSIKDGSIKASVLQRTATTQAKAGDRSAARQTIQEAIQVINASTEAVMDKSLAIQEAAEALAELGDVNTALDIARGLRNDERKGGALRDIAGAQARAGDISHALETVREIKDPFNHDFALQRIAEAQADRGDMQGAFQTAAAIKRNNWNKAIALIRIAEAQLGSRDLEAASLTLQQAGQVALKIQDAKGRADKLGWVARVTAEAGDKLSASRIVQEALAATKNITDKKEKDSPLLRIVEAQTQMGDVKGALQTTASMSSDFFTDRAFYQIARAQAQTGDIDGALKTAAISQGYEFMWRGYTLQFIAKIQAQKGDKKGASLWVAKQNQPSDTALALLGLAEGIMMEGQPVDMNPRVLSF
jgi:tetratricopeptide (TPR) repeat protein